MNGSEIIQEVPAWAGPFVVASVVLTGLTIFAVLGSRSLRHPDREGGSPPPSTVPTAGRRGRAGRSRARKFGIWQRFAL